MKHSLIYAILSLFLVACSDDAPSIVNPNNQGPSSQSRWLINQASVFDGGPGKDGIPSIDNPNFSIAIEVDFLADDDLILGIRVDNEIKGYPHPILDWHEIVNDRIGSESIALTYCPLTGTGIGWNRIIEGVETEFGVSGLLYNSNLIPYDRRTDSNWSQQRLQCVNGELIGMLPETFSFIETTWASWKAAYPQSQVLTTETGFSRDYGRYPYGDFRTNNDRLLFPIDVSDDRLPAKQRVLGVQVNEEVKAYPWQDNGTIDLLTDEIDMQSVIIIRDLEHEVLVAFEVNDPNEYSIVEDNFPNVVRDKNGNVFDIFGFSETTETVLKKPTQFIGYWFSWGAFYEGLEIGG